MFEKYLTPELTKALMSTLRVAWQSMLAIFIVMAVIAIIVFGFAKVSGLKKKNQ